MARRALTMPCAQTVAYSGMSNKAVMLLSSPLTAEQLCTAIQDEWVARQTHNGPHAVEVLGGGLELGQVGAAEEPRVDVAVVGGKGPTDGGGGVCVGLAGGDDGCVLAAGDADLKRTDRCMTVLHVKAQGAKGSGSCKHNLDSQAVMTAVQGARGHQGSTWTY